MSGYFDSPQFNPNVEKHSRASFGFLTHLQKQYDAAQFSDMLVFIKVPVDITDKLAFRNLVQATLLLDRQSIYWFSELEYSFTQQFSILGAIRVLAGQDNSYFGAWRGENSFSLGLRYIW